MVVHRVNTQDYADQRWYSSTLGRFLTADPWDGSAATTNPASWNQYAYVENDSVNYTDRSGLHKDICSEEMADTDWCRAKTGHSELRLLGGLHFDNPSERNVWFGSITTVWVTNGPGGGGGGGNSASPHEALKRAFERIQSTLSSAAAAAKYLTEHVLDCWSGMESQFDPKAVAGTHKGLFQLNGAAWKDSAIGTAFTDANAFDPAQNAAAAVGYLSKLIRDRVGGSAYDSGRVTTADISRALTDYRWGQIPHTRTTSTRRESWIVRKH